MSASAQAYETNDQSPPKDPGKENDNPKSSVSCLIAMFDTNSKDPSKRRSETVDSRTSRERLMRRVQPLGDMQPNAAFSEGSRSRFSSDVTNPKKTSGPGVGSCETISENETLSELSITGDAFNAVESKPLSTIEDEGFRGEHHREAANFPVQSEITIEPLYSSDSHSKNCERSLVSQQISYDPSNPADSSMLHYTSEDRSKSSKREANADADNALPVVEKEDRISEFHPRQWGKALHRFRKTLSERYDFRKVLSARNRLRKVLPSGIRVRKALSERYRRSFLPHTSSGDTCPSPPIQSKRMAESRERTFIAIKPDAVQRGIVGKVIERFEQRGYKLVAMKMVRPSRAHLEEHYVELKDKPFFPTLIEYMSSGPVVAMVWEGLDVVKQGRAMLGATNPLNSAPGTIRGDFSIMTGRNIVHGSDSLQSAKREIAHWFKPEEIMEWSCANDKWIYE